MATNGASVEFRIPQEPLPVPAVDDIGPVPLISADSQSFVVIKSAADLDELSDDNDIADVSILQEHKQILQDELAQFELASAYPQPSVTNIGPSRGNQTVWNKNIGSIQNRSDPSLRNNTLQPSLSRSHVLLENAESRPNGFDPPAEVGGSDMNRSILPAMPQPATQINGDDTENTAISIVSFAPSDFGSEEIQAKVTQLIDENMHLKDTIIQNNLSMKAQYEKIRIWQEDVERVHEAHKNKFQEAKKCIETLKEENACLKQENDNLRYSLQHQRVEHDKTKQLLTEASENNLKDFELDVANKKIKELEEDFQKLKIKNVDKHSIETAMWKGMEEKLQRYENELEQAYKQIRSLEKGIGDQDRSKSEKLKLTQEKLLLSEMANERANKEIQSLRNHVARNVQTTDDTSKIQLALDQALAEQNRLNGELESRNATLMDAHVKSKKQEQELQQAIDMARQYEAMVKDLREKEEQAKIEAWMTKQKLAETEQKYAAAQQPKPQYPPDFNVGELAYIRQQLMQSQKALTESEQNRAVADAKMGTLKNENAELRRQLETRQSDGDDLFALRAQLDVYKTDFEAERDAKEDVKRDKNKIAEDLQHLHRRNQQLQEEIEVLREQLQQYGSVPRSHSSSSRNQAAASSPITQRYTCPICNIKFRSLKLVQDHLDNCICHAPW